MPQNTLNLQIFKFSFFFDFILKLATQCFKIKKMNSPIFLNLLNLIINMIFSVSLTIFAFPTTSGVITLWLQQILIVNI
jgi:hypothetical protein